MKYNINLCRRKLSKIKGWCLDTSMLYGRATDLGMACALGISLKQYRRELRQFGSYVIDYNNSTILFNHSLALKAKEYFYYKYMITQKLIEKN